MVITRTQEIPKYQDWNFKSKRETNYLTTEMLSEKENLQLTQKELINQQPKARSNPIEKIAFLV
ncbi:hypothetical protein [uncultured Allomuricauda sp.]|uniref:hypothetical protein n=1 Tax=Flagellimonas sp. W118 TaxID=3410791 RepID=UPI00260A95E7|nr:hypothetical protein [uncultured Allomuricauda sp.]